MGSLISRRAPMGVWQAEPPQGVARQAAALQFGHVGLCARPQAAGAKRDVALAESASP